jgi:hypothetical protein
MNPDHYHHHQHQHRGTALSVGAYVIISSPSFVGCIPVVFLLILKRINANCHYGRKESRALQMLCHQSLVSLYLLSKSKIYL